MPSVEISAEKHAALAGEELGEHQHRLAHALEAIAQSNARRSSLLRGLPWTDHEWWIEILQFAAVLELISGQRIENFVAAVLLVLGTYFLRRYRYRQHRQRAEQLLRASSLSADLLAGQRRFAVRDHRYWRSAKAQQAEQDAAAVVRSALAELVPARSRPAALGYAALYTTLILSLPAAAILAAQRLQPPLLGLSCGWAIWLGLLTLLYWNSSRSTAALQQFCASYAGFVKAELPVARSRSLGLPYSLQESLALHRQRFETNGLAASLLLLLGLAQIGVVTLLFGLSWHPTGLCVALLGTFILALLLVWRWQKLLLPRLDEAFQRDELLAEFSAGEMYRQEAQAGGQRLNVLREQEAGSLGYRAARFAAQAARRPAYSGIFVNALALLMWTGASMFVIFVLWSFGSVGAESWSDLFTWLAAGIPIYLLPLAAIPAWRDNIAAQIMRYFQGELKSFYRVREHSSGPWTALRERLQSSHEHHSQ